MIDVNAMLIFVRVVDTGSFAEAARALQMSKSTVSRRVAELEDALGVRLLQRTTRNLTLTPSGTTFFEHCKRVKQDAEEARASVTAFQSEPQGKLRVTASTLFAERVLSPLLPQYLERYPRAQIELYVANRRTDVVEEGFDVAIRIGAMEPSSLIARKLRPMVHYLCASPDYATKRELPDAPADLIKHPCIVYSPTRGSSAKWLLQGPGDSTVTVEVSGPLLVNSYAVALDSALAGRGIADVPAFLCSGPIRAGQLRRVLPDWSRPKNWVHALYPSRLHMSPTVKTFLDFVTECISQRPWFLKDDE